MTTIVITAVLGVAVGLVMGFFFGLFYAHPLPAEVLMRDGIQPTWTQFLLRWSPVIFIAVVFWAGIVVVAWWLLA